MWLISVENNLLRATLHSSAFSPSSHRCAPPSDPPLPLPPLQNCRHFQTDPKTQPSKVSVSSALIPEHWGISRALCHPKLAESEEEGERVGSKTHTVIYTFSLKPWVIEEGAELTDTHAFFRNSVCICFAKSREGKCGTLYIFFVCNEKKKVRFLKHQMSCGSSSLHFKSFQCRSDYQNKLCYNKLLFV